MSLLSTYYESGITSVAGVAAKKELLPSELLAGVEETENEIGNAIVRSALAWGGAGSPSQV